jgi:hypothetical protein
VLQHLPHAPLLTFGSIFFGMARILPTHKDAAQNLGRFRVPGDSCSWSGGAWLGNPGAGGVEGGEGAVVGVVEGVQVLLGGLDLGMAHTFHD